MPTPNKLIVGAYATAPSTLGWDKAKETSYYRALGEHPLVGGIEHPFTGRLHPHDELWFAENIASDWQVVFTTIPGVMARLSNNPKFGIASTDALGRDEALAFYQSARQAICKLNAHKGHQVVTHIQLHSAPVNTANNASRQALMDSLTELSTWDWDGTKLVIEHCDAFNSEQLPQKGFLSLTDEIAAISQVNQQQGCDIGLSINWGRSAIEGLSIETPIEHIRQAKDAGLLTGLIFSGACDDPSSPYGLWQDAHMPPAFDSSIEHYAPESLMSAQQISRSVQAANNDLGFIGGKISVRPNNLTIEQRVQYNTSLLALINRAYQ